MNNHTQYVEDAQRGDVEAFTELVKLFQDYAVGVAVSMTKDVHVAEDVAQESFLHAYTKLDQLRTPAAFPGWFRRIVLKFADRHIRSRRKASAHGDAHGEGAWVSTPESELQSSESRALIWEAIWELPEQERELVVHYYMSDLPQAIIAQSLNLSLNTVKNRLRSARDRLRERMIETMNEDFERLKPSQDTHFAERVFREIRRISPASLTTMMRSSGALTAGSVQSVDQIVEKETHYSGSYRLRLTYTDDVTDEVPRDLFLKTGNGNEEYLFYTHLSSALTSPVSVRCYGAELPSDPKSDEFVVLLEDVSATHTVPEFGTEIPWPDPRIAESIIRTFGRFHAISWGNWEEGESSGQRWYRPISGNAKDLCEEVFGWTPGIRPAAATLRQYCDTSVEGMEAFIGFMGDRLSRDQQSMFRRVNKAFPGLLIKRLRTHQNLTLAHRDTNPWNVLVPRKGVDYPVCLIDWMNIRVWTGPDDVAANICRFWSPEVQREMEKDMARLHYDTLVENGVTGYSWDAYRADYQLGVMEQFYKRAWRSRYLEWDEQSLWICENVMSAFERLECEVLLG
jgi:RNA polymerase sigma factor (sigma-70 family)